ncbi:rhomboid family intramembrane serine protease [Accumulibacter sp.]|uniref:rhomboid family intramembrane serine protease n=1 Tax=Accumulibacter sp. TaxID=2053492 RepID=UPI0028C46D1D|nr:rhomboid family intramembrane serine protease [Accumulibacter sp.]
MAKARIYVFGGLAAGFAMVIVKQGGFSSDLLVTLPILLLFALPVGLHFRNQLRFGQVLVTLTDEAIEAPNLAAREKTLRWADVDTIALDLKQVTPVLAFHLKEVDGFRSSRKSWAGINPSKPTLGLSAFSPADQERLLDAVRRRHRLAIGAIDSEPGATGNELREKREFQERIRALQPYTWATHALIGANILIWLATLFYGAEVARTPAETLLLWGGNAASEVQKGEWWRLLSAIFLHGSLVHLAMNMLGLYTAGMTVERIYGPRLLLIIYLGSGLLGSALSLHFAAQQAVSVGASGAVFGVAGALLVAVLQHRDKLPRSFSKQTQAGIGFFVLYSLVQGFGHNGIDNAAHVGGLLAGCLAAFILPKRFDLDYYRSVFASRAVTALAILGLATVGLAAMAPLATVDVGRIVASSQSQLLERAVIRFDTGLKAIAHDQDEVKAGRLSEQEADERSRSVHAPIFRSITEDFSQAVLRPGDPRAPLIQDMRRMSELLTESLAMASVFDKNSGKLEPADPARMAEIESELVAVGERVTKATQGVEPKK